MNRHRTDTLSLVCGLLFVAVAGWYLSGAHRDARILGWFLAGALVLLGLLGLVRTLRRGGAAQVGPADDLLAPATPGAGPTASTTPYAPPAGGHLADQPVTAPPGRAAGPSGSRD